MIWRAHEYGYLIARWRDVCRRARLRMRVLGESDGHRVYTISTPRLKPTGGIYLSAGIHGDEVAATEALLAWATAHAEQLREMPLFIVPCLNPWGLINNRRSNASDIDLNRTFSNPQVPHIAQLKERVRGYRFTAAVMLHEDYDAHGMYLYELVKEGDSWGYDLLDAARPIIPPDPRTKIDISEAHNGLVLRTEIPRRFFKRFGLPEAVWLQLEHTNRTFTMEAPSEMALELRVKALQIMLGECVNRSLKGA